jgi:hypothetical protein
MSERSDISMLYREFADALAEVLAENAADDVVQRTPWALSLTVNLRDRDEKR